MRYSNLSPPFKNIYCKNLKTKKIKNTRLKNFETSVKITSAVPLKLQAFRPPLSESNNSYAFTQQSREAPTECAAHCSDFRLGRDGRSNAQCRFTPATDSLKKTHLCRLRHSLCFNLHTFYHSFFTLSRFFLNNFCFLYLRLELHPPRYYNAVKANL